MPFTQTVAASDVQRRGAPLASPAEAGWLGSPLPTALVALLYCLWVLHLPVFPTQDGPMHLYFTQVLRDVLRHSNGFYGQFYFLRHILPPYSLYYYALMALGSVVSLPVADKIIVCGYIVSFCFGLRFLARSIGPGGGLQALLATVLVLNWPLGMGFVNFSLSTTFAFWALGLWCRFAGRAEPGGDLRRRVGFVLLCCAMLLTHPVPLLLVGGFGVLHLAMLAWRDRRMPVRDTTTLLLGMLTLGYVRLFTLGHMLRQVHVSSERPLQHEKTLLKGYVLLHNTAVFAGQSGEDLLYRAAIYALLAGSLAMALVQWRRDRREARRFKATSTATGADRTVAHAWLVFAAMLLLLFPLLPEDLNNSAYFAARLTLYVWLAAVLAGSAMVWRDRRLLWAGAAVALLLTATVLHMAEQRIAPVAREIAAAESTEAVPEHRVGLLLHAPSYRLDHSITFDPFFWNGVRVFRRTDSVMFNTPWLDLPILPLGARPVLPTSRMSPNDLEYPPGLRKTLQGSAPVRETLLSQVDFVLIGFGQQGAARDGDALLEGGPDRWSCVADGFFEVCTRAGQGEVHASR